MDNVSIDSKEESVRKGLLQRVLRRTVTKGEIVFPAVPGLVDDYVNVCNETFLALGVEYSDEDLAHLRGVLEAQMAESYKSSSRSDIVVTYESGQGLSASYTVRPSWVSVDQAYNNWVATREPPLFGTEPDARVWALASEASDPTTFPVLDIGAGTGRNSLALARRGHPVDAVEMTAKFAETIRKDAAEQFLKVNVIEREVSASKGDLRDDYELILLSEVVSDFRTVDQVRGIFALAANRLAPGGRLVFNVFLPRGNYVPDAAAREFGQQAYTSIFTREELADAVEGLPLVLTSDESVYDYEKANQPAESWPPTSWYENWTRGLDVFDAAPDDRPIDMRWLVYRKSAS